MQLSESTVSMRGKAATLQALSSNGFRVPAFSVVPAGCGASLSGRVSELIAELGLPLAVRSSASVEDGVAHSFAGQFESYLNLHDAEQVEAAINRCRVSLRTSSVEQYCQAHGIGTTDLRMDVIVQRMVQPELSGVAFTVNPVSGCEEVVVEATTGPGDELLAGRRSSLPDDSSFLREHRPEIEATANDIAEHFGCPQDVEFAVSDGVVWILQSRPVTCVSTTGISGQWTNANFREGGVSSSVCSPLMWSLYNLIWDSSLKSSLREIRLLSGDFEAGRFTFGRPYWNLGALKQCLAKVPGYVEREFDTDLGIEISYEGEGVQTPVTPRIVLRFLPTVFAVRRFIRRQIAKANELLNGGYERDYFQFETSYFRTIFALSLAKLDFRHFFPDVNFPALMSGLPDVRHTAPMRRIRQMVQQDNLDVAALQQEFGYHYHAGLDIRHPRWDEDPDYVESLARNPGMQSEPLSDQYQQAVAEELGSIVVWRRPLFRRKLTRLRQLVWLREEMRDCSNRMYHLIRKYVLKIADARGLGEDIFFMTYQEVLSDDCAAVEERRRTFRRFRNFTPPNEVGQSVVSRDKPSVGTGTNGTLRGLSACTGAVRGIARVVRTATEAIQLPAGSILVCPHTDPGWTPALSRATGVVAEAGGMLSHAAVICREFSLPAVLSVPDACGRIPDGSMVVVDGDAGVIQLLP